MGASGEVKPGVDIADTDSQCHPRSPAARGTVYAMSDTQPTDDATDLPPT
jgi:hypothetical protein